MQQESWGGLELEFVDERAERAESGERGERVLGFVDKKQNMHNRKAEGFWG